MFWFLGLVAAASCLSATAMADRPRDYMLGIPKDDTRIISEYFITGMQLSLDHTRSIYGKANMLRLRGSGVASYPLGQVEARADLRILFLELGGSVGYRTVWRNLSFEPGKDGSYCDNCDRAARRHLDHILASGPTTDRFAFIEARLQAHLPFNDYFAITAIAATRYEGRKDRSFDWFFTDIHDSGWAQRIESTFFFKHRNWGAIGPYVQMLRLPRDGQHVIRWAGGFNLLTRPGLVNQDDMLFLTFLMRPNDPLYGLHSYFMPVRALLVYRLMWSLE